MYDTEQKITPLECEIMQSRKQLMFAEKNIIALRDELTDAIDKRDYRRALQTLTSLYAPLQRAVTQQEISYALRQVQKKTP